MNQNKNSQQNKQLNQKLDVEQLKVKFLNKSMANNYKILSFLDNGSFCAVFKAIYQKYEDNDKNKKLLKQKIVCFKVEDHCKNGKKSSCTLEREARVLKDMNEEIGFPKLYYFQKQERHSYVFTQLLGKNLSYYHKICDKKFSIQTVSMIAYQFIKRIKTLHSKGFLHRDIKPDNIMLGIQEEKTIYMVDFGLSTVYRNKEGKHVEFQENVGSIGTMRFNSINCHRRNQQSRRDDLQSFGYVLIYLLKGSLPWQVVQINDFWERNDEVQKLKEQISNELLCMGLPEQFLKYLNYVTNLGFYQDPDYNYLIDLFYNLIMKNQWNINFYFDWQKKSDNDGSYSYQKQSDKQIEIKSKNRSNQKRHNSVQTIKHFKTLNQQTSISKNYVDISSNGGYESNNTSFQTKFSKVDLQKQFSVASQTTSKFKKRSSVASINFINNSDYISKTKLNKYQNQYSSNVSPTQDSQEEMGLEFFQTLQPQMGSSIIQNQQDGSTKTGFSGFYNIEKSEKNINNNNKQGLNIVNETYLDNFDSLQDYTVGNKNGDKFKKQNKNFLGIKTNSKLNQEKQIPLEFNDDLTVDIQCTSIDYNHQSLLNFNNKQNKKNNSSIGDQIQQKSFNFNVKKLRQNQLIN